MKITNRKAKKLRKDFPIFKNNPRLAYLDNAASAQKPQDVIKFVDGFYRRAYANVHRGLYSLSEKSTDLYGKAREIVADFINASPEEIIFTRGTTDSINTLSYILDKLIPKDRNEILLTEMEHHSNLVPWQQLAKRNKMKLRFVRIKDDFTLDIEDFKKKLTKKTAIFSVTHLSNTLGTVNPVREMINRAKEQRVLSVVDAAQSIPRLRVDVHDLDCDFLAFSGHKVYGPTGIGVLYGKKKLLRKLPPFEFGGEMIKNVSFRSSTFADTPEKFEAGTPNITGALGLGVALKYIQKLGIENISSWEKEITKYALRKLGAIDEIEIYHADNSLGVISFNLPRVHSHDVASLLDEKGIAIRAGHHCTMPLIDSLGLKKKGGTCRISFGIYNTFQDIDRLVQTLKEIRERFK